MVVLFVFWCLYGGVRGGGHHVRSDRKKSVRHYHHHRWQCWFLFVCLLLQCSSSSPFFHLWEIFVLVYSASSSFDTFLLHLTWAQQTFPLFRIWENLWVKKVVFDISASPTFALSSSYLSLLLSFLSLRLSVWDDCLAPSRKQVLSSALSLSVNCRRSFA